MRRHTDQGYLIRIWRDRAEGPLRATLTTIATPHVRHQFADLDELQSFLIAQTNAAEPSRSEKGQPTPSGDYTHCTPEEAWLKNLYE